MTSPQQRDGRALVVVDVQNDVVGAAFDRDAVVARIADLVERARAGGVPVVWVQHSDAGMEIGSREWELAAELTRAPDEPLVHKTHGDSFEGTDLEDVLTALDVRQLVVAGAETDACIRSTIHGAFTRGYDVTLVEDAHTTGDKSQWGAPPPEQVIAHTNLYWRYQTAPDRTAAVVSARDVDFARS